MLAAVGCLGEGLPGLSMWGLVFGWDWLPFQTRAMQSKAQKTLRIDVHSVG